MNKVYIPVSVIIPCYCSSKTITRAVKSVLNQTVLPLELILIDDYSLDNGLTVTMLQNLKKTYEKYLSINIFCLSKNVGTGSARNIGLEKSTQDYIAFLDSDDVWHPQKLEIQFNYMSKHSEIFFSCHDGEICTDGKIRKFYEKKILQNVHWFSINPYKLLIKHYVNGGTSSVMIKRLNKLKFKSGKKYSEDYLLWLEYNFLSCGVYSKVELSAMFKPPYGFSGLSAELWKIEQGELDTYKNLADKKYINKFLQLIISAYSFLKFVRRCIICKYKGWLQKN